MAHEAAIKRGTVIRHEGDAHLVISVVEHKSGKQKPTVHLGLRNLRTGRALDRTADQLGDIELVDYAARSMQYLYDEAGARVFMDAETFEQHKLSAEQIGPAADFLVLGNEYRVLAIDQQPVSVQLPDVVALQVADTAPPSKQGGAGSNVMKEATLASGLVIRVPLFIKTGDVIRIEATSRHYVGKESG
jgi:elongation factor P